MLQGRPIKIGKIENVIIHGETEAISLEAQLTIQIKSNK